MRRIDYPITRLPDSPVRPLLKWAGGKRQLLPDLRRHYPVRFHRYIEPFFGSGAVFFDLHSSGRLKGHEVVLVDANTDLVGCYESVRDEPDRVADRLGELADGHAAEGAAHYYRIRDGCFNPTRAARRAADGRIAYTAELAAMLLYLNRTGFNGLFRLNAQGAFNVPAGRYPRPSIVTRAALRRVADALGAPGVRLLWGSFDLARDLATRDDFLYFDPPYAPISRTANFTSYTELRFTAGDQERLQALLVELTRRGCYVLSSNSTAWEIAALYEQNAAARHAGLRTIRVRARRAINSNASRRGTVEEFLITNISRQDG